MKTLRKGGRGGHNPSPYVKYNKRPQQYSAAYHAWRRLALIGGVEGNENKEREQARQEPRP